MATFRASTPYLVPAHCLMYLIHMVQEQVYDIYKNDWRVSGKAINKAVKGGKGKAATADLSPSSPTRASTRTRRKSVKLA